MKERMVRWNKNELRNRARETSLWLVMVALVYLFGTPFILLFQKTIIIIEVIFLNFIANSGILSRLVGLILKDEVFANVAFQNISNIDIYGVTVAKGSIIDVAIAPESSVLSQMIVIIGADFLLIVLGVILLRYGLTIQRSWRLSPVSIARRVFILVGSITQLQAIISIWQHPISVEGLDAIQFPAIATRLLKISGPAYTDLIEKIEPVLSLLFPLTIIALIYSFLSFVIIILNSSLRRRIYAKKGVLFLIILLMGISAAILRIGVDKEKPPLSTATVVLASPTELTPISTSAKPTAVSIAGENYQYRYLINGRLGLIKGINYNVHYAGQVDNEERAALYDRDFTIMRRAGFNMILGSDLSEELLPKEVRNNITERELANHLKEFDELTLDKARQYGFGVVMPYYRLSARGDWSNSEYKEKVRKDVVSWVKRFKDHPALEVWAIGNEVFHDINLLGPQYKTRTEYFAEFYLELVDAVHEIDPYHPIVYRDAEIAYIEPLKKVFEKDGQRRPWFIYGMNLFDSNLTAIHYGSIIEKWIKLNWDIPVMITELGPYGLKPEVRPQAYKNILRRIRYQRPGAILGSFVYVWTTNSPVAIDRQFALVDKNAIPVDGSLEAINTEFREETEITEEE